MIAFKKTVAGLAVLIGVLLSPPVFDRLFSMVRLLEVEKPYLWLVSALFVMAGLYCKSAGRYSIGIAFLLFNLQFLISAELVARVGVKVFAPDKELTLSRRGNLSYDHLRVYRAHPFVQFTGVPSTQLIGNEALGDLAAFNNFGFIGEDFVYEKPADVIRIAALGASTTGRGYPAVLEAYLNERLAPSGRRVETMNFGLGFYTTANTLVNFALNVVDFKPDYIVLHHGWNDCGVRAEPSQYRSDYSHHLKAFEPPRFVADRYLLRASVIYRVVKFRFGAPQWIFIGAAARVPRETPQRPMNSRELETFERNLEEIIHLAGLQGIQVVLTTMPRTSDPSMAMFDDHVCLDQFNEVSRSLAARYGESIHFLDLAATMAVGLGGHFTDLAHLDEEGRRLKAEAIGDYLLPELVR